MKKLFNKKIIVTMITVFLLAVITLPQAYGYFTNHCQGEGGRVLQLVNDTKVKEEKDELNKTIQVKNTGEVSVFTRVKIIYGGSQDVKITKSDNWVEGDDGYFYYKDVVDVDDETDSLKAEITSNKKIDEDFDIVVVCESTPYVVYDDKEPVNNSSYKGWHLKTEEQGAD